MQGEQQMKKSLVESIRKTLDILKEMELEPDLDVIKQKIRTPNDLIPWVMDYGNPDYDSEGNPISVNMRDLMVGLGPRMEGIIKNQRDPDVAKYLQDLARRAGLDVTEMPKTPVTVGPNDIWFAVNHDDYDWPYISKNPIDEDEFDYVANHTTGERYILIEWNDERMVVSSKGRTLKELAENFYRDYNIEERMGEDEYAEFPVFSDPVEALQYWCENSFPDGDSSSGFAVVDARTGDFVYEPK